MEVSTRLICIAVLDVEEVRLNVSLRHSFGTTKGLNRVDPHWCQYITDLQYRNCTYASASVFNKIPYELEVLFAEITDWL